MNAEPRAERLGELLCSVGESPVWHAAEQALYWTDIPARRLCRYTPADGQARHWDLPEMAGCIAKRGTGWLAAMETGLYALPALDSQQPAPPAMALATVRHAAPGMRFNDGRCDRQGRFWAGTMVQDMALGRDAGRLYRYAGGELAMPLDLPLVVPNGMAFSPDGRTMYLSDSHPDRQVVWALDYDPDHGVPTRRRVFIERLPAGRPDGAAVDQDGAYWICGNDAGLLYRYTPDGRLDRSLRLPVAKPAMCAFGGSGLDTLFITTIRPPATPAGALDGALFSLRPGTRGLEEPAYLG
ncbi:SMP-30/gluconolactonase/LRE family protein [Bordetella petrii]|uniref:SMP-30/gluconolactonase/LRE family protein n=1 Tax=Bordetella petrii TaxID=94624 RepID=UPI001E62B137|nr:SMP-30/gluconolactonase/LRE family protein [Bordetella petrii]MCD0504425.1 SMP-30/gluconolactonase/LRE family protein [Bordetella petrii]